jgi:hypothetical protein
MDAGRQRNGESHRFGLPEFFFFSKWKKNVVGLAGKSRVGRVTLITQFLFFGLIIFFLFSLWFLYTVLENWIAPTIIFSLLYIGAKYI